jgi:hypothetical protein
MKLPKSRFLAQCANLGGTATLLLVSAVLHFPTSRAHGAQPPAHKISAANIDVIQNDTGNTAGSVTVSTSLSINDMRIRNGSSRGDFNVQIGDAGSDDPTNGLLMVSISQNGRDNGEQVTPDDTINYCAPAFDGNANGLWCVIQDLTSDRAEYNINCAAGYFRYADWYCGWARNATGSNGGTNNLFIGNPNLVLGTHFRGISNGRSRVDLRAFGIYSTNSFATNTGVLIVNHAKNEGNYSTSLANADGTWDIWVKDNFGNGTAVEQDPTAFVFIPKTNTLVVSGKFGLDSTGTNAVILVHSGLSPAFTITNIAVGRYRLAIPGGAPALGVLLLSPDGGRTINQDNAVSYEADGNNWIIESRDVGVFPPALEACTNEPVASFVYIPAGTAGFTIAPTNTLVTSEFALAATFSVQLDLTPTNEVTINMTSSNPAEGTVSPGSVTFYPTNWNIPQIVTVTGQDDGATDGAVAYSIILDPAVSGDTNYNGLNPADVQVVNVDDEQAGITATPTNALFTTEAGGTATFNVFLHRAPSADVTIDLSSDTLTEGTVSPASLTFNTGNWNVPQPVTVTGADDFKKDGNKTYKIVTAAAISTDLSYNGINAADVTVINVDNDSPNLNWTYNLPLTVVEGGTTNYSLALATQPDSNVVVTVTSLDTNVATVSPTNLTFTPLDWSTPKVVTVTGVDNLVTNGTTPFTINNVIATTDPFYVDFAGTRGLQGVRIDNEGQLILPSGDCIYGVGMPAIGIDGQARLDDIDATTYNTGTLSIALTANGNASDKLEIRNTGTGTGQIGVSGSDVTYEGNTIGTFSGGLNLTTLTVSFNANSTRPAVQQLVRNITFVTATNDPSLATRSVVFTLNDGLGGTAISGKSIRVGAVRLTQYQEGGDYGYGLFSGVADIALSEVGNATPWPAGRTPAPQQGLWLDWPDAGSPNQSQVLMRFDNFIGTNYWQVPSGAVVVSAELLLSINDAGDGGRLFRMLMPFNEQTNTWDYWGAGIQADDTEARSVYESQFGVEDGSGATTVGIVSIGVTPDIQAWVNGETNYGWAFIGFPLATDGTGFSPSEYAVVGERPRLRVLWLVPQYQSVSFRQGVAGYTGTHDSNIRQAQPDVNFVSDLYIWSDANDAGNTNNTQGLLRFDNIIGSATNQIPAGAVIHEAVLEMPSVGVDSMGDGGKFHAILQAWDDTTVTWNFFGGDGIQANGVEAAVTPTATAGNSALIPDVQGTINTFEVTADVQAWANGTPNYGWCLLPWPGGSNGWGTRSSEFNTLVYPLEPERERPRLRVYFSPGTPSVRATVRILSASPTQVSIRITGLPNATYKVMRAPAVTGTYGALNPNVSTDGSGVGTYNDNSPLSGAAFYRVDFVSQP